MAYFLINIIVLKPYLPLKATNIKDKNTLNEENII